MERGNHSEEEEEGVKLGTETTETVRKLNRLKTM
jgi:hypothetical protein